MGAILVKLKIGGMMMNKDLTVGAPAKVLWQYSLPLFGSIVFQQLYNIADSFVAGRYIGTSALAAVGNSYEITLIYIAFAFGCNIGTSVVVARYFGAKRYEQLKTAVTTSLIASTALGILLILTGFFFSSKLLALINTPAEIFADSLEYLLIYIGGFLFLLIYNISTGIFSALGDSKTPFLFLAASSVSNIAVDILFVTAFDMGVAGVAWATLLCQSLACFCAFGVVLHRLKGIYSGRAALFSGLILKELTAIAVPSILQQLFISVGNIIIQSLINSFGTAAVGGYSAAVKLNNMMVTSITALGNGMSNYAAQNAGAKKARRISNGFAAGVKIALLFALGFAALYLVFSPQLVQLFITDGNKDALAVGVQYLRILSPFYFVVALKLIADGILRGTNRMRLFMTATFTDLLLRVVLAILLSSQLKLVGIWMSWPVGWIIAALMSLFFYHAVKQDYFGIPADEIDPEEFSALSEN